MNEFFFIEFRKFFGISFHSLFSRQPLLRSTAWQLARFHKSLLFTLPLTVRSSLSHSLPCVSHGLSIDIDSLCFIFCRFFFVIISLLILLLLLYSVFTLNSQSTGNQAKLGRDRPDNHDLSRAAQHFCCLISCCCCCYWCCYCCSEAACTYYCPCTFVCSHLYTLRQRVVARPQLTFVCAFMFSCRF